MGMQRVGHDLATEQQAYSPNLLPTNYYFFKASQQTFCSENASTISRMHKMLSKSSSNPEAQIFMLQE